MKVRCPNCGEPVMVSGLGRPRLNITLNKVCETLISHCSVAEAAKELGCSEGYIFNALKADGLRLRDVIKG